MSQAARFASDSTLVTPRLSFGAMSVAPELQRLRGEGPSQPRFEPCLPKPGKVPPSGPYWIHEIKYDGFRILAHRRGARHSVAGSDRGVAHSILRHRWRGHRLRR